MEVLNENIITDSEAKKLMDKRAKDKDDLKFEQINAHETLDKFIALKEEDAKKITEELFKISKLNERHIATIINFLPKDKDDLRAILHKDFNSLTEDEVNLILDTVKKFA